ncbi:MAG: glycyl-radical enzyme activating protein [Candidatus Thorarchaeota archaeon]
MPNLDTNRSGIVLNVQRFSTEDGPGIRTTVFLMGCALRCQWCQNPETWTVTPQIVWYQDRCIGAQHCIPACPKEALTLTVDGMSINRQRCDSCGACIPVCPAKALELLGTERSIDDVVAEVLRDRPFYEESDGGVTISGGDPLFQFHFAHALLKRFQEAGLHTALDTAGYGPASQFQTLIQNSDLILLDLKQMDPSQHETLTGVPLEPILINARWLGGQNNPVWIRTPIIPGHTDSLDNIAQIAAFIRLNLPNVERWDFLGFNKLCKAKWVRLDRAFPCRDVPLVSKKHMTRLVEMAKESQVTQITWSGATQESTRQTEPQN